ncbi:MAG: Isoniazid-inducible protein iniA [Naasia sp.]|nr:Isoniazid-inducible protein iniA [Naasia sp.]
MADLSELVERGIELATAGGREDLRRRLQHTQQRLSQPSIRVIVVGEFKQGKSQLINGLVNAQVCPVDDDIATSVPTIVRYGAEPRAVVLATQAGTVQEGSADSEPPIERRPVPLEELPAHVSERGNPGNRRKLAGAEVFLPRKLLADGLEIIDSPGVGGLNSPHTLTTLAALPTADALLFVTGASQEFTEPELTFLRQAARMVPNIACVLTKTDLYPEWRRIAELDRGHLDLLLPGVPLLPVSSELRLQAGRLNDKELNAESGFPELIGYLRREVVGRIDVLQRRSAVHDLRSTTEQLALALQSELSALLHPAGTPGVVAELEAAKDRTDELRRRSSKWQVTLNDGVTDLISDMEHDLRDRMRIIQREADSAISDGDPGPVWDQLTDWLEQRIASAVSDTFVWTSERSEWLSQEVARNFAESEVPLPGLEVGSADDVLEPVELLDDLDPGRLGPMQKLLIGMRGSYGGVLMVGLVTGLIGLGLVNPFSVAAGVLIGRKAFKDDRDARLKRRQTDARNLVHRLIDDVVFQVGKQLKDRLRVVQRTIRDHFSAIAEEQSRSLKDSVVAAQKAAGLYSQQREARISELRRALQHTEGLRRSLLVDATPGGPVAATGEPPTVIPAASARPAIGQA